MHKNEAMESTVTLYLLHLVKSYSLVSVYTIKFLS